VNALPGDPTAVRTVAATVLETTTAMTEVGSIVGAQRTALSWEGDAADAVERRLTTTLAGADGLGSAAADVAAALLDYADVLDKAQDAARDAAADAARARRRYEADRFDLLAYAEHAVARGALLAAGAAAQVAARVAADRIRAAMGAGVPAADALADVVHRDRAVPDDVLTRGSFDPEDVQQHAIGSCYVLSTLMGLLRTDAGDDFLREHVRWDPARRGYVVTLYDDGKPVEVLVDAVYDEGVEHGPGGNGVGIVSIYEAALGLHLGYTDLDNGGLPEHAMETITGRDADAYSTTDSGRNGWARSQDDIRDRLQDGASVTADTGGRPDPTEVQAQVRRNGQVVDVDVTVSGAHAYMVERIEADGSVWVRNPWGVGNPYDDGEAFRLTAQDFARIFGRVSVSEVPA